MGKLILDMSISLDGSIGIPNDYRLHNWYFSNEDSINVAIVKELIEATGAIVIGRRSYDIADAVDGFVDDPYKVPYFVVSHSVPEKPAKGETKFIFVTEGIEETLEQARAAAGAKDVVIGGGANLAQQFLKAGLIDELQLHVVPVVMGEGLRLFDYIDSLIELEQIKVVPATGVTHLTYRVVK
jgi:dihydrofolate reductase